MKILLTGGAGFIGSAVVRQAIDAGHQVVNVDALTYAACLGNLPCMAGHPKYTLEQVDVCDRVAVGDVFARHTPDVVMHLAAESHVDRSIAGPEVFVQTNIVGTLNMLEAARAHWVAQGKPPQFRFHHISTDEVFGSLPKVPTLKFCETTAYAPRSPYAASKAAADHLVRAWGETYGLPVLVTNCSNNYGPYHFPEKLIPVVITKALRGQSIPIYGKGDNVRDWLYVEDHAAALLLVLEKASVGATYTIGGNAEVSNLNIVQKICAILDKKCPKASRYADQISFVADRPGHDLRYAIDATQIAQDLGWRPSVTLEEGLDKTVQWYLDNAAWWQAKSVRAHHGFHCSSH